MARASAADDAGPAAPAKRSEIRQLTGMRAVAAGWIVVYHFRDLTLGLVPELTPVRFLFDGGYFAVDVFFVLSGWIIAYQYLRAFPGGWGRGRGPYFSYLLKRLARIYPLQVVTLAILVVLVVGADLVGIPVTPASSFTVGGALQDLFLVRGWIVPTQGWNFPAWSLSAEWFAYLLFPVVAIVAAAAARRHSVLLVTAVVCVAVEAAASVLLPGFDGMPHPLVRVMVAFVLGAAIQAAGPLRLPPAVAGWLGLAALVALVLGAHLVPTTPGRAAAALVLAAVAVAGLASGGGPAVRLLGSRVVEYGGRISYGVYMAHGIVLMVVAVAVGGLLRLVPLATVLTWAWPARAGLALVAMLLVIPAGAALYHLVERPAQRWMTTPLRRLSPPAAEVDR